MKQIVDMLMISLFFLLPSCVKTSSPVNFFSEVEALMSQHPDSALSRLERMEYIEILSQKDKAHYYLLLTEARDKNYVEHTSDSLITIATDYYEKTNDVKRKAKAWFYRGRINQDLHSPLKAQEYYLHALRDEERLQDYALLGRIYNYIGMLYNYQNVLEKVIPYLEKAYKSFQFIHDTIGQTYVLGDMARTYVVLKQLDSAQVFYERIMPYAKEAGAVTIPSELGSVYQERGMFEKAHSSILTALSWTENEILRYPMYLTLGEYYLRVNHLDSADYYLKKSLSAPSLYTRAGALKYLYESSKNRKKWEVAISYNDKYEALHDSIEQVTATESIRTIESLYNYQELNHTLSQQELALTQREKERYVYTFAICIFLSLLIVLYMKWKKIKVASIKREGELEWSIEMQRQRNQAQKEENERQIELLKGAIANIKAEKEQELKIISLELEKQRLEICNESIENTESKHLISLAILQKSPVYEKFKDKMFVKFKSDDWEKLEKLLNDVYNGFTLRLKKSFPSISDVELKACMLTKIDLSAYRISKILAYNSSVLRPRIYKKISGKEGSVHDFVTFIISF